MFSGVADIRSAANICWLVKHIMTKKLYETDSYINKFEATVLSCEPCKDGFALILDQTAFFPEEGGQHCDLGVLYLAEAACCAGGAEAGDSMAAVEKADGFAGAACCAGGAETGDSMAAAEKVDGLAGAAAVASVKVLDVQIKGDIIKHTVSGPIAVGSHVYGEIDWETRFSYMQNHSGEHLLSGILHNNFGLNNVGFHLGTDGMTLDVDGPLTDEQLAWAEAAAQKAIYENRPITVSFPSKEELKEMDYRSKIEIDGQVRIVTIDGYDVCACCAPHVSRTGEIGILKLINYFPHRGGMRLELKCGSRAYDDYLSLHDQTKAVMAMLSAKRENISDYVNKQSETVSTLRCELKAMKERLTMLSLQKEYIGNSIVAWTDEAGFDELRYCANLIQNEVEGICLLLSAETKNAEPGACCTTCGSSEKLDDEAAAEKTYQYVICSRNMNIKQIVSDMNKTLNGKGGGKENYAQGKLTASIYGIKEFMSAHAQ